jgi:hypothetical protein
MEVGLLPGAQRHPRYLRRAVCSFQTERMAVGDRGKGSPPGACLVLASLRRRDLRLDEFQYLTTRSGDLIFETA